MTKVNEKTKPNQRFVPLKGIPESLAKERVSVSVVQAIAAQAGLNDKRYAFDDGIDLELISREPLTALSNFSLRIQVKSTENWKVKNGTISYRLKKRTYEQFSIDAPDCSHLLVLYTLPRKRSNWITCDNNESRFSHLPYYLDITGCPKANAKHKKTIYFPTGNVLTARALRSLYVNEAKKKAEALYV